MKFYLSRQGHQYGPWSEQEIIQHLREERLSWTDYLFDEKSKEWILLMDYPAFSGELKKIMTDMPKTPTEKQTQQSDKEWYILKSENKYGPFAYLEVIRMLQEKSLYEYDFIWNSKQTQQWKRVSELEEFSSNRIKELNQSKDPAVKDTFFRRRYARKAYGASLLVHNSKSVWKGQSMEISSGGAGIVIENPDFEPGQTLFLHFKIGDGVPPFNAICSIVSKHLINDEKKTTKYGVKFTSISQTVQSAIKDYTEKAAA